MMLEFDYRGRREQNSSAKRAIAAEARKLVQPGQRSILDTGTTTLELAALLQDGQDIWERPPAQLLESLEREFRFVPPRKFGYSVVEAIEAMHDGRVKAFVALSQPIVWIPCS